MRQLRALLAALVYVSAVSVAGTVAIPDPTSPLAVVPVATGIAVVGHAMWSGELDAAGYGVVAMWAAVVLVSAGAGLLAVTTEFGDSLVPVVERRSARLVATGTLCLVLVTAYAYVRKN